MLHLVSPRLLAVSFFFFFFLVLLHPYAVSCVRDQGAPTLAAMVVRREPKRLVPLPSLVLLFSTVLGARPCVPSRGGWCTASFLPFPCNSVFFLGLILETLRIGGNEISSNIIIHVDGMGGGDQGEEEGRYVFGECW